MLFFISVVLFLRLFTCSFSKTKMAKQWPTLHATELSLLLAMVFYVHSVVLICQPFLSYHSTLLLAFASVPCCFFIISNCLEMEKSFANLYWHHLLFISALLTTVCESNNHDLPRGILIFFLGVVFLSLHSIYILYQNQVGDQQKDDSSEENVVPLLIEIAFSFQGNGIAMIGRWFIPRDSFLWSMVGAGLLFSIGVMFFCYYVFSSGQSRSHHQLLRVFRQFYQLGFWEQLFFQSLPMEFLSSFF